MSLTASDVMKLRGWTVYSRCDASVLRFSHLLLVSYSFIFLKSTLSLSLFLFRLALFHLCRKIPSLSCFASIVFSATRLRTNKGTSAFKNFINLACLIFRRENSFSLSLCSVLRQSRLLKRLSCQLFMHQDSTKFILDYVFFKTSQRKIDYFQLHYSTSLFHSEIRYRFE